MSRARRTAGARVAMVLAMAAISLACGPTLVTMRQTTRDFTPGSYGGIYDRWTRAADDFDFGRLGEVLHVTATFEAWEFRWAYVVRYAQDHSFTTEERTRLLEETLLDAQARHRFFVTLGTPIYRDGDLSGPTSDIRVLLVEPSGRQFEPVELIRIPRPSADQRRYFPSIHRQRHTFRIAFPALGEDGGPTIPQNATHVILRFAAAAGTVDLRWDLSEGPDPIEVPPPVDVIPAEPIGEDAAGAVTEGTSEGGALEDGSAVGPGSDTGGGETGPVEEPVSPSDTPTP